MLTSRQRVACGINKDRCLCLGQLFGEEFHQNVSALEDLTPIAQGAREMRAPRSLQLAARPRKRLPHARVFDPPP